MKDWTRAIQPPYERSRTRAGHTGKRRIHRMNDTSGWKRPASPAIALAGVNLALGRGAARVHILKDIDLNIGHGEAIGMVGPSGSGKSTLLMVMAGLERAGTGTVVVAASHVGARGGAAPDALRGATCG